MKPISNILADMHLILGTRKTMRAGNKVGGFVSSCGEFLDLWAVWPDGTECSLEEKSDMEALLTWKSDDYEIKCAFGYDETSSPVYI
jgi:hypothetical protein